jgi:hypothetical protein
MEVTHLVACRAVAFVDADRVAGGVEIWREFELDLVLHGATVAGSGVGFEFGRGHVLMRGSDSSEECR